MRGARAIWKLIGVVAALCLVHPAGGSAAGPLTFSECLGEMPGAGCEALTPHLLDGAYDVAVSPRDGDVYVTAVNSGVIAHFKRAEDGSLVYTDCISDASGFGCTDPPGSALTVPSELAFAADGGHLYVSGIHTLTTLSVSSTGSLAYQSCLGDTAATTCTDLPGSPFNTATDVTVAPGGGALYTTSFQGYHVARFTIDGAGDPTYQGCYGNTNADGCTDLPGTPLGYTRDAVVSPNGGELYVSAEIQGLTHFDIGAGGALTFEGCESSGPSPPCVDVPGSPLDYSYGIAVSPDGSTVWVAAAADVGAISRFTTNSSGDPTFADCLADDSSSGCTALPGAAIRQVHHLELSGDGSTLYASAAGRGLAQFDVGSGGTLSYSGCLADTAVAGCTDLQGSPFTLPEGIALSNDDRYLYTASYTGDGISSFLTTPPPVLDKTPPDTSIGKHPKRKSKKRKAKFTFSSSEPGSTFECSVDGASATSCASPFKVKFKRGKHTFSVAAVDAAGNLDATPATGRWKVKRKRHKHHHG